MFILLDLTRLKCLTHRGSLSITSNMVQNFISRKKALVLVSICV